MVAVAVLIDVFVAVEVAVLVAVLVDVAVLVAVFVVVAVLVAVLVLVAVTVRVVGLAAATRPTVNPMLSNENGTKPSYPSRAASLLVPANECISKKLSVGREEERNRNKIKDAYIVGNVLAVSSLLTTRALTPRLAPETAASATVTTVGNRMFDGSVA